MSQEIAYKGSFTDDRVPSNIFVVRSINDYVENEVKAVVHSKPLTLSKISLTDGIYV